MVHWHERIQGVELTLTYEQGELASARIPSNRDVIQNAVLIRDVPRRLDTDASGSFYVDVTIPSHTYQDHFSDDRDMVQTVLNSLLIQDRSEARVCRHLHAYAHDVELDIPSPSPLQFDIMRGHGLQPVKHGGPIDRSDMPEFIDRYIDDILPDLPYRPSELVFQSDESERIITRIDLDDVVST